MQLDTKKTVSTGFQTIDHKNPDHHLRVGDLYVKKGSSCHNSENDALFPWANADRIRERQSPSLL